MAFFNEIGAGRYNRFLQKLFQMKGGPPARQLASEITPVFPLFSGAELRHLEGWQKFMMLVSLGAPGAGNFNVARLRNPGSMLMILEKILLVNTSGAAAGYFVTMNNGKTATVDLATILPTTQSGVDGRGVPQPTAHLSFSSIAQSGTLNVANIQLLASTSYDVISTDVQEFCLSPQGFVEATTAAANIPLQATFWWRERAVEESELLTS